MSKWEKIKLRLKNEHGIIANPKFTRSYAGQNMRSAGAFSWFTRLEDTICEIGSQWSMTKLLKDKGEWVIDRTNFEIAICPSELK